MGRGRLSLVAVALLVAAVLVAAVGAGQAQPRGAGRFEVQRAVTAGYLDLGKERGYDIALSMPNDRVVIFSAVRIEELKHESFDLTYSVYAVRNQGSLERGVVRARFGSLGRVALRFRPRGPLSRRDPQSGCEGGPRTTQHGSFVGHLSFRGEGDYFHVSSAKGKAQIARSPRLRCEKGEALDSQPRSLRKYVAPGPLFSDTYSLALLYASARSHGRYVGIKAMHPEGSTAGANVELGIVERRHAMAVGH